MTQRQFLAILFIGAILRLINLGAGELWYDEAFTLVVSRLSMPNMLQALAGDVHPPLFYVIMWVWVHLFGSAAWIVRLPSVGLSLVSLWLAWRVSVELRWTPAAQLAGVATMAVIPFELHFAQEARMYALLQTAILWALWMLIRRNWLLASVGILAAIYTHNYGLIFLPPLFLIAMAGELLRPAHLPPNDYGFRKSGDCVKCEWVPGDECNFKALFKTFIVPVLLWLPWAVVLVRQMQSVAGGYWIQPVTLGSIIYAAYMLFTGFSMPEPWQPAAVLVIIGLLVYTIWRVMQLKPRGYEILLMVGIMPLLLAVAASIVWKPVLLFRGLIASAPTLYLLIGWSISRLSFYRRIYAWFIIGPVLAAGLVGHYTLAPELKHLTLVTIKDVQNDFKPGDIVYHVNDGSMIGWLAYAPSLPQYQMPACEEITLGQLSELTRHGIGIQEVELSELEFTRAWIVWGDGPTSSQCEHDKAQAIVSNAMLSHLSRSDEYVKSGVWLYVRDQTSY